MDAKHAIICLLGLQHAEILDIELRSKAGRAIVELRYCPSHARCPDCGWKLTRMHSWQRCSLSGPPLGIYTRVTLNILFPRAYCVFCRRNRSPEIPFRHPKLTSMSCGFAEVAGRLMEETTCEAAARLLGANSRSLWELDQFRMRLLLSRMQLPPAVDVSYLSADEVHFRTLWVGHRKGPFAKQWEPQFVTNLVSFREAKVLSNALGRGGAALDEALSVLTDEQRVSCDKFSVDMHDAFIASARRMCPNAEISVDRFHVAQHVNRAFDEVRKAEFKKARDSQNTFLQGMLAPSRRFILVERHRERSRLETKMLSQLRLLNDAIHSAMLLTEQFHATLDKTDLAAFRKALFDWYLLVRESRLEPFRKLAKTISRYRSYIETYIKSRLTTAVSEGLNNKIKTLKRMAYGYSNPTSFKNKILQRCGYLNHYSINTNDLFLKCPC